MSVLNTNTKRIVVVTLAVVLTSSYLTYNIYNKAAISVTKDGYAKKGWSLNNYKEGDITKLNINKFPLSDKSVNLLRGVDKRLVNIILDATNFIPIDIRNSTRTILEQAHMYKSGKTYKDGIIKKSNHQKGIAVDMLPIINNYSMYNKKDRDYKQRWAYFVGFMQAIALKNGEKLRVGYKWRITPTHVIERPIHTNSLKDYNHFELVL